MTSEFIAAPVRSMDVEHALLANVDVDLIRKCIAELPPQLRAVLVMRGLAEMLYKELPRLPASPWVRLCLVFRAGGNNYSRAFVAGSLVYSGRMPPTRRDFLDLAMRAAALPAAGEFFSIWLRAADEHKHSVAPPEPSLLRDYKPKFFTADDFSALQAFTEILIPTDDTPGAREAHCAHYIDFVLQAAAEFAPDMQYQWHDAMSALKAAGFHTADAKGRSTLVEAISKPERDRAAAHPAYAAYRLIKQQNTFAFYTSRAGMIETLDYRGNSFNATFPACNHPEHHAV